MAGDPATTSAESAGRVPTAMAAARAAVDLAAHASRAATAAAAAVCTPRGLLGLGTEITWGAAHLLMYPYGVLTEGPPAIDRVGLRELDPVARGIYLRDVESAGTPIVLVHGMVDNRSVMQVLRSRLQRKGFTRVVSVNYPLTTTDVRAAAARLGTAIAHICRQCGFDRVHIIAHSLGGLIARYYIQRLSGADHVAVCVTLGSPHQGSLSAHLLPGQLARQLRPGSAVLQDLAGPQPGCATAFVCYWSDLDQVILPARNARLEHPDLTVRNILVRGVGHMSLPVHPGVVHGVATLLHDVDLPAPSRHPRHDGADQVVG